ncbi:MAG: hypothetical protein CFE29_06220 [Bradyrhizobiaceae bacterium PARB1]|jgi:hypothetical protein|nr:MAG: hypothetical protein CFE29_06220 [Bradyrhizobiaceae bacterium PARB1]
MGGETRCRAGAAAALLALGLVVSGCASTVADLPVVGAPANLPQRPAQPGEYLPVHDIPTARGKDTTLAPADQAKLEADLIKARDRQAVVTPADAAAKTSTR